MADVRKALLNFVSIQRRHDPDLARHVKREATKWPAMVRPRCCFVLGGGALLLAVLVDGAMAPQAGLCVVRLVLRPGKLWSELVRF